LLGSSSETEASATISILYGDADAARSIMEAVSPDNIRAPPGVTVEARTVGPRLRLTVSCTGGLKSLIATVDDLLSCVQAAERAIFNVVE